ncbi:uncharacterized protein TrAtP1_002712 [Trichoderma atroviride]|uniref:uncharacterized protein n=1 Tax=Hypocrea atroviridis TaxID=63577 RepID=UPI00332FAD3D|nr:hypothetical protein TrAtP1_002712 [Trichoderma atroviride]
MDVLEANEAFEDVDGQYQFTGTLVVYRDDNNIYHGFSKGRHVSPSDIRREHLSHSILIPVSAYMPLFPANFLRASDPLPCDIFAKRPLLTSYDRYHQGPQPNCIADNVLREAEICELLRKNPHPNIAEYIGCQVADGKIMSICFAKYDQTLMQAVNPHHYSKRMFRANRQGLESYLHVLEGVERGLRHLHKLGIIHNDINPSNIMLKGNVPVIIDFGSCQKEGESLEGIGRTYEWFDERVQLSLCRNDFDALEEIRIWLADDSKDFQFDE